jgi:hypothetical protein
MHGRRSKVLMVVAAIAVSIFGYLDAKTDDGRICRRANKLQPAGVEIDIFAHRGRLHPPRTQGAVHLPEWIIT